MLMVSVALAGFPVTFKFGPLFGYVKLHTGAIVTSGVIEAQARVTPPPVGVTYP